MKTLKKTVSDGVEIYHEEVYMVQPDGLTRKGKVHLICKLKKSIYGWNKLLDNGIWNLIMCHLFGFKAMKFWTI